MSPAIGIHRHVAKGPVPVSTASYVFTSESVSEGHPDKVCDRISDAIVDTYLTADPEARVAVETLTTTNRIVLAGEVRGPEHVTAETLEDVARAAVKDIGYEQDGFHWQNAEVCVYVHRQSADIAMGVDAAGNKDEGAGDQGIMFGYACRETDVLMPAPIYFAHQILKSLAEARHSGAEPHLGPDTKGQVSLRYENGMPVGATSVVVSTQHSEDLDQDRVREIVRPHVMNVLPDGWMCPEEQFYVNPTGRFVIGGPDGDAGLTGRKIIVDTYGGAAPHGGGAFSGKDPTKVDRSAAYAARYLAKNVVAAELADRCTIQLSLRDRRFASRCRSISTQGTRPTRSTPNGCPRPCANWSICAARHQRAFGSEQADLCAHRRLRPFRPPAGAGRRLFLGKNRPGRRPSIGADRLINGGPWRRAHRRNGSSTAGAGAENCESGAARLLEPCCRVSRSICRPTMTRARSAEPVRGRQKASGWKSALAPASTCWQASPITPRQSASSAASLHQRRVQPFGGHRRRGIGQHQCVHRGRRQPPDRCPSRPVGRAVSYCSPTLGRRPATINGASSSGRNRSPPWHAS